MKNSILSIIGLIIGIVCGIYIPEFMSKIDFLGTIYINLLKFMIVPILLTTIMVTIYKSSKQKGKIVFKSVALFIVMFVVTFLITSGLVTLLNSGKTLNYEFVEWTGEISNITFQEIITNLFPNNMVTMFQNNMLFALIIFAVCLGKAASNVEYGDKVIEVVEGLKNIFNKLLEWILLFTPIAVFSLIGNTVAKYGSSIFGVGARYIGLAYFCSLITIIVVMILPVWIFAKMSPIKYIKNVSKVWLMTITTCSSAATLPTTIKVCNDKLGIPSKITDIVVPLGCTIHMCGGAVSFALLGLFCSSLFGVQITLSTFILMIIASLLINMAAPGIPNGGIVIGASYLSMLGIPLEFIGFYSGIYKVLDMVYTTLNVTGDITANILINQSEMKKKKIKIRG